MLKQERQETGSILKTTQRVKLAIIYLIKTAERFSINISMYDRTFPFITSIFMLI